MTTTPVALEEDEARHASELEGFDAPDAPPPRLRDTPYGLTPFVLMFVVSVISGIASEVGNVALPTIARDININLLAIGGIFAITGTLSLAGNLLLGWFGDRARRVVLFGAGIIGVGIASISTSRTVSTGTFASAYAATSVADDFKNVPSNSLLADYYPLSARGRVFGLLVTAQSLSTVVSLVAAGVTITVIGWRSTFVILGGVLILLGIIVLLGLREPRRGYFERRAMGLDEAASQREDPPQSFGEGWRSFWAVRTLKRLWLASLLSQAGTVAYIAYFPFLLSDTYHLDALGRSLASLPVVVLATSGAYVGGRLIDRLGKRSPSSILRMIAVFSIIPLAGVLVIAGQPPLALVLIASSVYGFGVQATQPAIFALCSQVIPPSVRTQGLQVLYLASIPAQFALALVLAPIANNYGIPASFIVSAPIFVVYVVVLYSTADFFEIDRRNALIGAVAAEEARRAAAEGEAKLLVCRKVNVSYGGNQVLFGVDLTVDQGEIVALLGTNGAGKSTLLRAVMGTQEASDGAILFDNRNITHMPPHEIARLGVALMPGGRGLFPGLTVEENLKLGTWLVDSDDVQALLDESYAMFEVLHERRHQLAGMLSGGEQQMLSLAQAFMAKPRLLLIDELSLGLSPAVVGELLEKVRAIHARGTTVVVVEQSVNVALTIANRAVFMEKGEVRFAGPTADLLSRPDILRSVYVKGTNARTAAVSRPQRAAATEEAAEPSGPLLEVSHLTKSFGGVHALEDVSFTLDAGAILGVIGPNGSGKTTLFDIVSGYQAPDSGEVLLAGTDVTRVPAHLRAREHLVRRFQDARLFPSLTVQENLLVALDQQAAAANHLGEAVALPRFRRAERGMRRSADELITLLNLGAHRDKFVRELSTGLRRIVDMAVVLASRPRVLLLDEPSSGIAQLEAESLASLLLRVHRETGCAMLLVEHDMTLITAVSDELLAMVNGRVLCRGPAATVLNDERLVEAYLGGSDAAIRRSGSRA